MIQPSALPAKSSLATAAGTQTGSAENSGIPGGFAALLALGLPAAGDGETAVKTPGELVASLLRQMTGKEGGKNLPEGLPDKATVAGEGATEAGEDAGPAQDGDAGLHTAAGEGSDAIANLPFAATAASGPSQNAIEALAKAIEKPQAANENSEVTGNRLEVLSNVLTRFTNGQPGNASSETTGSGKSAPADDAKTLPQGQQQTKPDGAQTTQRPAQTPAPDVKLVASTPAPASSANSQSADVAIQVSVNLPKFPGAPLQSQAQAERTGEVPALPVNTNSRDAQASRPGAAALRPVVEITQANAAAVPPESADTDNAEKPAGEAPRPTRLTRDSTSSAETRSTTSTQPRAVTVSIETSQGDIAVPRAGDLQPLLAAREAQSLTQAGTNALQAAPANPAQSARLDFAAIVDRLVEAREAAVPHAVKATIAHADFGQVSLRFDHNRAGLTVSMTSSDPDFAPAVQAATASGQGSATGDNGSNAPRQDAQNQQSASLASGQQQSQGSARGSERDRTGTTGQDNSNPNQPTQDETDPAGGDGIYA